MITVPPLRCCQQSLAEQIQLVNQDGERTVCDYSRGDIDEHHLIRLAGEWRRVMA